MWQDEWPQPGAPCALKPFGALTDPSTSFQGPSGIRMGAAGMSKADVGAPRLARGVLNLLCVCSIYSMHYHAFTGSKSTVSA